MTWPELAHAAWITACNTDVIPGVPLPIFCYIIVVAIVAWRAAA